MVSKYCEDVDGSMDCFDIGDKAVIRNAINPKDNGLEVIIDSEIKLHKDAPLSGKVYEVIFCDGSGRFAVSAHKLFPVIGAG